MHDLPLHGVTETRLPDDAPEARAALADALAGDPQDRGERLRAVAGRYPTFLEAWARLADWARDGGDPVAAYAFARTGYHRGLDAVRRAGWRGQGPIPWAHEPNRGFLESLHALMRSAAAIGEDAEAVRCRNFLLELDPGDPLGVGRPDPPGPAGPGPAGLH
jgi:hypothetical protein